ncbi:MULTISPECIES: S1C family serine protease [Stenotrophomonas]|uniref:S1C family serine protease n=1 Tax=Stenotrophomonas TaxID=40323 RepID=UPI0021CA1456|nr:MULTISPECIES: serine protease [Stenotrophomonas]MCU1136831.1 trypsin-like peptidase domain-containing protein [Stenotrophomonas maltophilia]MEC4339841.1 serine protease [Stenotrophomonas pavanii]
MKRILATAALLVLSGSSLAAELSPAQVYRAASPSVVLVWAADAKGKDLQQGSGVVIDNGLVVSNCHVVNAGPALSVETKGRRYSATLDAREQSRDLCTLRVEGLNAPPARIGNSAAAEIGERVYAIGAPQGFDLTLSDGLLSGRRGKGEVQLLQTSAPISPGSSGGGLFNSSGELIGITTLITVDAQQVNFAVPVESVMFVATRPNRDARSTKAAVRRLSTALRQDGDWVTVYNNPEQVRVELDMDTINAHDRVVTVAQRNTYATPRAFGGITGVSQVLQVRRYDCAARATELGAYELLDADRNTLLSNRDDLGLRSPIASGSTNEPSFEAVCEPYLR